MGSEAAELELPLVQDVQLTEVMRIRGKTLREKNEKPQDGEKLLQANEFVFRLHFTHQRDLCFLSWKVILDQPGKATIIGTSQHWTPDLTNLMRRQLLDPPAVFWKKPDAPEVVDCNEADALEFGERLVELAKIRKVMYFLVAFTDGLEPAHLKCSVIFNI
ncbi:PREDICTED: olfactory marker protein [Thamnophis sirtalis]|uniref:Olfactory marker protein n=1 Tax=Thamnophis sirtalis TaxID=35019 RepID=A0A6I9YP78_9SAUR|nr:PREDICTED: olfactory marker protein [Thamnophis sirtalis]